jgi:hypothetical protein
MLDANEELQASAEKDIRYPLTTGWVDPRSGQETVEKGNIFGTAGN